MTHSFAQASIIETNGLIAKNQQIAASCGYFVLIAPSCAALFLQFIQLIS